MPTPESPKITTLSNILLMMKSLTDRARLPPIIPYRVIVIHVRVRAPRPPFRAAKPMAPILFRPDLWVPNSASRRDSAEAPLASRTELC